MTTEKTVTVADVYEDEQVVAEMVASYTEAETDEARAEVVKDLAEKLGKTVQSVRAKLVREGVYKAKERKTKTGEPVVSKEKLVQEIEKAMGLEVGDLESLEKATKRVLKLVLDAVRK
jgi:hypothetical protein